MTELLHIWSESAARALQPLAADARHRSIDMSRGSATVKLVQTVLRDMERGPLCVLAFGRPETDGVFPSLFGHDRALTLSLRPLAPSASETLIKGVLGDGVAAQIAREDLAGLRSLARPTFADVSCLVAAAEALFAVGERASAQVGGTRGASCVRTASAIPNGSARLRRAPTIAARASCTPRGRDRGSLASPAGEMLRRTGETRDRCAPC